MAPVHSYYHRKKPGRANRRYHAKDPRSTPDDSGRTVHESGGTDEYRAFEYQTRNLHANSARGSRTGYAVIWRNDFVFARRDQSNLHEGNPRLDGGRSNAGLSPPVDAAAWRAAQQPRKPQA